ncbi:MAG: hypothetical protein Q8P24_00185 [Desulfobacterales bacterium]|nr:hypothetical protein [Desulfobacterales bacterium]
MNPTRNYVFVPFSGTGCLRNRAKSAAVLWLLVFLGVTLPGPPAAAEGPGRQGNPAQILSGPVEEPAVQTLVQDQDPDVSLRRQKDEYDVKIPKTVMELQQFRRSDSINIRKGAGKEGTATLINLNPSINTWFLLFIQWKDTVSSETYHLENPLHGTQRVMLDPDYAAGIVMVSETGLSRCALWADPGAAELSRAAASGKTYAPLCSGRLFLRNRTQGNKTRLEIVTDLLRKNVWQGEKITNLVRETFYRDAFLSTAELIQAKNAGAGRRPRPPGAPVRPLIEPRYADHFLAPQDLGIALEGQDGDKILVGRWYRVRDLPGLFVSVVQPALVAEQVIQSQGLQVNPLDEVESKALVFLIAFDLDLFDLGFEMGTDHPRVGWSERVPEKSRDQTLPGPDGIDTTEPLVMTGLLNPSGRNRTAATFIGGFKRYHGAFRWSELAFKNHGSHYGFIQNGTVLSKLQPGLSTVLVYEDDTVKLKTWQEKDNGTLRAIRHARQNGVPIIEYDEANEKSRVGVLVPRWAQGNWSGSLDERFRTVRAGLGLQEAEGRRFLIYGYFSAATPSAMARVFQAYTCKYAMLLDINALEHTYLAVYRHQGPEISAQHLVKGMSVLDKRKADKVLARFVGYADNRDFFYLLRKDGS